MSLAEIDNLDSPFFLMLLDPLISLSLGVNQQWIPIASSADNSVIDRDAVGWQSLHVPGADLDGSLEGLAEAVALGEGDV